MRNIVILASALLLASCSTAQVDKFKQLSANYQSVVATVNSNIAATAPLVGRACDELQFIAMAIEPYAPQGGKAPQYFSAANGALGAYCATVPTNISSTASAVAAAIKAARAGYYNVTGRKLGEG